MRAGGGKSKGSEYEREVCKALSKWVSGGKREDLFWRSAMSGGRATVARKRGANLVAHAGDITATHVEGHVLTDHFYIECKRYADLRFGPFLTKNTGTLAGFWAVALKEAQSYDRIPMLIVREDRGDTLVLLPCEAQLTRGLTGYSFRLNPKAFMARVWQQRVDIYHFDMMMLKPFQAPAKYKADEGPWLMPGELARINAAPPTPTKPATRPRHSLAPQPRERKRL